MILAAIESRLKELQSNGRPLFSQVLTAVDPSTVIENGLIVKDCAFVVPMAEAADGEQMHSGIYSQNIFVSFGIMIGVKSINDRLGANVNSRLEAIKSIVRGSVLGWVPAKHYDEIEFSSGELVSFLNGGAFWIEQYKTTHYYRQEASQ